jgi:hypothetical protein
MNEKIEDLRRQIRVMEWDQVRNQLNANKVGYLNSLRQELTKLESELAPVAGEEPIEQLAEP